MWTARKKNADKCEGCNHLTTFPVACVTCQNLILEQSPQAGREAGSECMNLLSAKQLLWQALETLEMVYNLHDDIIDHNEIMWKATAKVKKAIELIGI